MEVLQCRRRIIELRGKNGEKGILKLIDQPEGMQCFLITEISDNKMLYLKNSVGIVSINIKDSYMLSNLSADDIKAVAVVYNESIRLTGGYNIDWTPHIKKTKEKKEEPKKASEINRAKSFSQKETEIENKKLKANDKGNKKPANNDMNEMLLKMLPQYLLKKGEKDTQDMSKLFSMMEMLNGKSNPDAGTVEKMMALLSNDAQKKHGEKSVGKEGLSEESRIQELSEELKIKENTGEDRFHKAQYDEKDAGKEELNEDRLNKDNLKEVDTEKLDEHKEQSEKENVEEALEEIEGASYCDLNIFEWSKVEYPFPRTGHYISGSAIIRGLKAYAIGIPGEFSYKPPPWQGEFTRFFNYLGQGYWVRVVAQKENVGL